MRIIIEMAFDEAAALRLLNFLARENARIYLGNPDLPSIYDPNVRVHYAPEREEEWADVINVILKGREDCDALAAARAGELMARGARALSIERGDWGALEARRLGLKHLPAKVVLRTRLEPGQTGMYHCIVKYRVGNHVYYDDPSARLGMYTRGRVSRKTLRQPRVKQAIYHEYLQVDLPPETQEPSTGPTMRGSGLVWSHPAFL